MRTYTHACIHTHMRIGSRPRSVSMRISTNACTHFYKCSQISGDCQSCVCKYIQSCVCIYVRMYISVHAHTCSYPRHVSVHGTRRGEHRCIFTSVNTLESMYIYVCTYTPYKWIMCMYTHTPHTSMQISGDTLVERGWAAIRI